MSMAKQPEKDQRRWTQSAQDCMQLGLHLHEAAEFAQDRER